MNTIREVVTEALAELCGHDGVALTLSGRLSEIIVQGQKVYFFISVSEREAPYWEGVRQAAENVVRSLPGVSAAVVSLAADRARAVDEVASASQNAQAFRADALGAGKSEGASSGGPSAPKPGGGFPSLGKVQHIIAVASGKGGVGKSTTTCNLALALRGLGLKVGVLDADIYGPSMPKLFGLRQKPEVLGERTLVPLDGFGVKVMSIGFVVDEEKALVWRGPMVMGAITQLLRDVAWGELDVLVVDMPPGTGDAQLTMAQNARLDGAIVVSTPQDLALIDARKGVAMFGQVGVPILGIIENMSYFICDSCGKRHEIFAHGGARAEAERLGVPMLGEIALDPLIRERSDGGLPVVVSEPDSSQAGVYRSISLAVAERLGIAIAR